MKAALGRTFLPEDANGGRAVVLSHKFWTGTLGADRRIAGQSLGLSGSAVLLAAFAAFVLLLAAIGLEGVLSQLVA